MIYINARFLTQKMTGVQRFATELSFRLMKMLGNEIKFVAPYNIIEKEISERLQTEVIGTHTGYYWEQIELPLYLKKKGNPILLNLCSMAPLFYKNNIVAIHDITWVRFPQTFTIPFRAVYHFLTPKICNKARGIITVSEFSKNEISSYYDISKERFEVVYNAVDSAFKPIEDEDLKKENFFVTVSSLKENKNFPIVLEAFNKLQSRMLDAKLYIIGDFKAKSFNKLDIQEYEKNPNVKLLGRVSDEDLIRFYSNAIAFIFPSLYEGFGIPPLEAQACGCPVVSSNSSSLPEVLEETALFASPMDATSFADKMYQIAKDSTLRNSLIEKGHANVNRFSWESSAHKVVEMIRKYS